MRVQYRIIAGSLLAVAAVWVAGAAVDSFIFHEGRFWDLLGVRTGLSGHELAHRLILMASFLLFGVILAGMAAQRERARAELAAGKDRLEVTLRSIGDAVITTDTRGRVTLLNPAACDLTGWPASEAIGQPIGSVFHVISEKTRQRCEEPVRQILAEGRTAGLVDYAVLISRDGTERAIADSGSPIRDARGRLMGAVLVFRDVTGQRRAARELKASEENYRAIFDSVNDAIFVHDPGTGAIVDVNRKTCELFSYQREEMLRLDVGALSADEPPYTQQEARQWISRAAAVGPQLFEWRAKDSSGRLFWAEVNLKLTTLGGQPRVLAVVRDVTDRRRAEAELRELTARYEAILAAMPDIVAEVNADRVYTWMNHAGHEFFGLGAIGREAACFFEGDQGTYDAVQQLFEGQENVIYVESWQRRKDGRKRLLAWWCRVLKDARGNVTGALSTARDITGQRAAEQERQRLESKMQHAQKLESLGILAGGIAHDFNNLLTAVVAHAGLALRFLPSESAARQSIEQIETAGRRAAELTSQLLAYSGRGRFVVQTLDLSRAVKEMGDLLKLAISKRAVLRYELSDDLPPIEADAGQIRQVLMNLITNASDALADQPGTITIATSVVEADRTYLSGMCFDDDLAESCYVCLEVSDTGCGMTPETLERIFDPFFTTKATGRGLGLAAVMGIVRGHKGGLKCYSEPGRGTTFKVLLPCAASARAIEETPAASPADWRGTGTVLVVDDDSGVRTVAAKIIETIGFSVLVADCGRQAVELFTAHADEIALVLLDMTMPDMSGDEVFHELRRIRPGVRVILSSGYNEPEAAGQLPGLSGFIQKPYKFDALLAKVRQVLEGA